MHDNIIGIFLSPNTYTKQLSSLEVFSLPSHYPSLFSINLSQCFCPPPQIVPDPVPNQRSSIWALQFISTPKYTPGFLTNSISSIHPSLNSLAQISSAISERRHGETSAPSSDHSGILAARWEDGTGSWLNCCRRV